MKGDIYSIRLTQAMRNDLRAWASQYDQKPAWLIKQILASALQAHVSESAQSDSPVTDLPHLPIPAGHPAYQAGSES